MKLYRSLIVLASLTVAFATTVAAQTTQDVTYSVSAINQFSVAGGAQTLSVTTATAGSAPTSVTSGIAATWAITTNEANKKITAQLDLPMAAGVTLKANLTAPTGGTSAGSVVLDNAAAVNVVTGISTAEQSGLSLVYTLGATTAAGVVPSATVTVTYTITN